MLKEKVLSYTAFFEPATEGGYIVYIPALPGLVTQGESLEEAKKMVIDAIQSYIAVMKEDGDEIPVESKDVIVDRVEAKIL
ncbi:MAG: hypothetical protein A2826_00865 [Candidatus Doudnabacteria bacterium RIFCSPHIGHO2_01_FULL_43_23]|uniref:HicB-like antitoxin of toxin-antitoxin system domain-containing protein n=1 Tax=Candidatus Doudnabacteria bacterium RIFCSPHIGHO2_01_FULL_43_23 TaxID=1817822 RepID=A0A1F5NR02_9BACT|nr:MAG: hypothetical protein A2826_00865 [Candidatus Doudnabacteria bacterium RIFCSPHIGHO2_01_FULL_43_23]